MIFNALITVVDGIFVGRGVGPDGIAAVNIVAPVYMVITGLGLMFGIGCSVTAGMKMSQNNVAGANRDVGQAAIVSTVAITLIVLALWLGEVWMLPMLGCSPVLMPLSMSYLNGLLPGMAFLLWQCVGMMVIRLDGSPKYAMLCNIVAAVLNIILDYIFIFSLGMGVKGAAVATALSLVVGGLMAAGYFCGFSYVLKLTACMKGWRRNVWRQMQVGSSAMISELAMSVMMITGNIMFMRYDGEAGVAAYSIACYLFPLFFMMSNAVAQSAQPIISYNYGAAKSARVRQALKVSLRVAALCGVIVGVGVALSARGIVSMFIPVDSTAGVLACGGLPLFATCAVFFALNIAFIGYYQSIGSSLKAVVYTLLRGVVLLVPAFIVMPYVFSGYGLWCAVPCSELLTLCVIVVGLCLRKA